MTEKEYENIQKQATEFNYTSMNYADFSGITGYKTLTINHNVIIMYKYNEIKSFMEYHWASNSPKDLLDNIDIKNGALITFVPKEWVNAFKNYGFTYFSTWQDYFLDNLDNIPKLEEMQEILFLRDNEYKEASSVTLKCAYQSRGFTGEQSDWFGDWLNNPNNTQSNAVIVERNQKDDILGIVATATYSNSEQSTSSIKGWIRMMAVHPQCQNKGIGRKLINQALAYCKQNGATSVFLAADECNHSAISLYKSLGFTPGSDLPQIDMIC